MTDTQKIEEIPAYYVTTNLVGEKHINGKVLYLEQIIIYDEDMLDEIFWDLKFNYDIADEDILWTADKMRRHYLRHPEDAEPHPLARYKGKIWEVYRGIEYQYVSRGENHDER